MLIGKLFFVWLSLACLGLVILFEVLSIRRLQAQIMREMSNTEVGGHTHNTDKAESDEAGVAHG